MNLPCNFAALVFKAYIVEAFFKIFMLGLELFELLTLVQTRKTKKHMPIVIYGTEYWNRVLNFDALVEAGTIHEEDLKIFRFFDDVDDAFEYLKEELTRHYVNRPPKEEMPL